MRIVLPPDADRRARRARRSTSRCRAVSLNTESLPSGSAITACMTAAQIRERQDYAIQQNITTLRNRVNELGVSEPIVQRQGIDRINVQLPGVQNSAEVKDILGRVATLEFRLEDMQNNAVEAAQTGRAPLGSKLYTHDAHRPPDPAEARDHRHRRSAHQRHLDHGAGRAGGQRSSSTRAPARAC